MQQIRAQEQIQYASLGWRFAAVAIDTLVLFGLLIIAIMVYIVVLSAQGKLDPNDAEAVQALSADIQRSTWISNVLVFGGLFVYYVVLEAIFGASIGKLVFRMRVTAADGSRPSGAAVVVRNLVRVPEAWLLYIPAGISCLASKKRQRLGDRVGRTVVVRRALVVTTAAGATASGGPAAWPAVPPAPTDDAVPAVPTSAPATYAPAPAPSPGVSETLATLKTAALAAHGAHLNYLRFSELELAATPDPNAESGYSPEYVSAWYTLADAVVALQKARAEADTAATRAQTTLSAAAADQPDLLHLFGELEPYFAAGSDEQVHEAFLRVARETSA